MRHIEFIKKLYHLSPSQLVNAIRLRRRKASYRRANPSAPLARKLTPFYYSRRDPLIQKAVERIWLGEDLNAVMRGFKGNAYDDRMIEYPYFAAWLMQRQTGLDILDVGCVLNHRLIANFLLERCNRVWLCNPSVEYKLYIRNPVFYHVATLERSFPGGEQFQLVTCLSTIEHIGYDNSHYGSDDPPRYHRPAAEPLLNSLAKLSRLVAKGGSLLISVPFGYREALVHPATFKIASQVFDYPALLQGKEVLGQGGVDCEIETFAATDNGWISTDPRHVDARYADGCPAAGAVAFIKGKKR